MQGVQTLLPVGSILLERYRVESLLGKGGFGAVYLVRDLRSRGNQYAVKELIDPDKRERRRFAFECEVLKRLDHPALPRVYRVFENAQAMRVYMLMDYVEGQNLETLRVQRREQRFPLAYVLQVMAPVIDAVTFLHAQQPPIIHRDIKPANIIVQSEDGRSVLVDFGIAKEYMQDATTSMVRHASPGYGAPEQYDRGTNPRTDVYGLAATIYALVTGVVPPVAFTRVTQRESKGIDPLMPARQVVEDIPEHVSLALQRAMAINDEERYATVQEFWQALRPQMVLPETPRILEPVALAEEGRDEEVVAATTSPVVHAAGTPKVPVKAAPEPVEPVVEPLAQRPRRRRRSWLVLLGIVLLLLVVGGISFAPGFFPGARGRTAVVAATATVGHAKDTAVATTPTVGSVSPTARATSGTVAASTIPRVASSYGGTIHNTPAQVDGTMQLTQMKQVGGSIQGYLTLSQGLQGDGNFTGTVSANRGIRFVVAAYAGHLPLLFEGQIAANGGMAGSYCSENNNQCAYSDGGYGTWQVGVR